MKAELKSKWVAALRSGEFKQCTARIRRHEGTPEETNCCLGVLCSVADVPVFEEPLYQGEKVVVQGLYSEVMNDLGVEPVIRSVLISLNDSERKTFPEIADWIEANIKTTDTPTTV